MKEFTKFIFESESKKFTEPELLTDYEAADSVSGQAKKDLIAKYNVGSSKYKDIQHKILLILKEIRKDKISFDTQDCINWYRLNDGFPERYDKVCKALEGESFDFIKFLKDYRFSKIESRKLVDKVRLNKSEWKYSCSPSDKSLMNSYLMLDQYIKEQDKDYQDSKKEEKDEFDMIVLKLSTEMKDFKTEFLNKVKDQAKRIYKNAPKNIKELNKKLSDLKDKDNKEKEEYISKGGRSWNWQDSAKGSINHREIAKINRSLIFLQSVVKITEDQFIKNQEDDASEKFDNNVNALAERIKDKNLNIANLKISNIDEDPKIFQMMISDGEKKMFARSIWAAEFSDLVTAHYRFIITDRK